MMSSGSPTRDQLLRGGRPSGRSRRSTASTAGRWRQLPGRCDWVASICLGNPNLAKVSLSAGLDRARRHAKRTGRIDLDYVRYSVAVAAVAEMWVGGGGYPS